MAIAIRTCGIAVASMAALLILNILLTSKRHIGQARMQRTIMGKGIKSGGIGVGVGVGVDAGAAQATNERTKTSNRDVVKICFLILSSVVMILKTKRAPVTVLFSAVASALFHYPYSS